MSLPFQPFQTELADHRVVVIPAELDDERRGRFVGKISAAVRQQAELASKCDAVLQVSGEIREQGDRILIPHEPAAPGAALAGEAQRELPSINEVWWLSWSLVRALGAAAPGTPHGGIAAATLYLDELGRAKLGDFGIAPVFEGVCGAEARTQIHCDGLVRTDDAGGRCSGVWSLLSEDETRETGWVAPYFAHELFGGTLRLNPKSDQFAAGTLLYLLAIGNHPFGASLGDPTLMAYFHLEPFALDEERPEWAEIFEREQKGFSSAADQPVLGWSVFIHKLLASDPGERFANAAEALAAADEFCPPAWGKTAEAIAEGLKQLDAGEVEALLDGVAPWRNDESLPVLWREPLARWLAVIEEQKEEIAAYKRLQQRLAEGQAALNNVELERAREIAHEVLASPRCDDPLRAGAEELVAFCDEQEEFIKSGADDLAKAYLESASECLEKEDFDHAREILNGLLKDPATPGARLAQVRRLIAEVELTEQRIEQQQAELAGAGDDLRAGRYDAARQRLEALLKEESLDDPTAAQARGLLEEVAEAQARRKRYVAALKAARSAWERADAEALDKHLAKVPEDVSDPEVADVRADLASRCGPLRQALEKRAAATAALEADDAETGLTHAEGVEQLGEIPQVLLDELNGLARRCQERIEELERIRIERVSEALRAAREDCEALRIEECRRRLESEVLPQSDLPEQMTAEAEELRKTCERIERARALLDHAGAHLEAGEFVEATALLDRFKDAGLPTELLGKRDELREQAERLRQEHERRERERLAGLLDEIDGRIEAGELEPADAALKPVEASQYLKGELRERAAATRSTIRQQQSILSAIRAAEDAVAREAEGLADVLAGLDRLPAELPEWASSRIAAVRKRADEIAERRRREAIARAASALDAAEAALDGGDLLAGRRQLETARGGLELEAKLLERHKSLTALAGQLEHWLPKVEAVSELVERKDYVAAQHELAALSSIETIPGNCQRRLTDLSNRVATAVSLRRAELDAELSALSSRLLERGRRARKLRQRIEAIGADALATEQHRARAAELWEQWNELEEPKRPKTPYVAAAAVVLIAAGLYFGGVFSGDEDEPAAPPAASVEVPSEEPSASVTPEAVEAPTTVIETEEPETEPPPEEQVAQRPVEESQIESEPGPTQVVETEPEPPAETVVQTQPAESQPGPELEPEREPERVVEQEPEPEPEPAKPTFEEVAGEYLAELRQELAGVAIGEGLPSTDQERFDVQASWNGRALLPFAELEFNEDAGRIAPDVDEVAEHFRLQVAALEAREGTVNLEIPLGDADGSSYEGVLRVVPAEEAAIGAVDLSARRVRMNGVARLDADSRADVGFAFGADYADGVFEIDEATRAAFANYLGELQADRLREDVPAIARALNLPEGMRLSSPDGFAGGARATLSVRGAGDVVFGQADATWNAETLRYEIDVAQAVASIRAGVRGVAADGAAREAVAKAWPEIRASVARSEAENAERRAYVQSCELVDVKLADAELADPLAVAVEVLVGPAESEQRISFTGRLAVREGKLAWDPRGTERATAAVVAQLPELAQTLDEKLAALASRPAADAASFYEVLAEVTQAKIERYGAATYGLAEGFAGATDPVDALVSVSAGLQRLTAPNVARDAFAVVFIEYYVGESEVYGLGWHAVTDAADAITGISGARVWRVMSAAELRSYAKPADFRGEYATDAELGERLLGRAFDDVLNASGGGSFGVMIAPDGPLWLVRWEQVRFQARRTPESGMISTLREILRTAAEGQRRVGVWCVPTLAGEWHGPADQVADFQLGELVPGKKPAEAHFRQWGALRFAAITDPTLAGDFGWAEFAGNVRREEIGYTFWERRWSDGRWNPTPFTSFALIQVP